MIDTTAKADDNIVDERKQLHLLEWLPVWGVLILVGLVYSPVIANAFNGDDFVHLTWLAQAIHNPELIWRNFHSPWLDITTAKFYRPLISLFMLADYVLWRGNGIGFHLTNLLCHLANTCLVWLILRQLSIKDNEQKLSYMWCVSSAALFGLYPLHPEAVSWITGRVDTFVTLFSLASMFFYMNWHASGVDNLKQRNGKWLLLCLFSMGLALLCKEMAIVLPAVFYIYELLMTNETATEWQNIGERLLLAMQKTSFCWCLLLLYFVVRYFSLGTLVGGYDNSFLSLDNCRIVLANWRHSLYFLCFPFNQTLLDQHSAINVLWGILLLGNVLLTIKGVFIERKNASIFLFLLAWLVLSLVPVIKLFNISPDLQGSRLAYLPSVPLCALFCFGYCFSYSKKLNTLVIVALGIMLSAAGAALLVNNSAWSQAETISQSILRELNSLSKSVNKDAIVYIVGLPDEVNGAYVCRNALDGMSKFPQISQDIRYCFNLDEINHVFPFGYARRSMIANKNRQTGQFFVWHAKKQKLDRFLLANSDLQQQLNLDFKKDISGRATIVDINLFGVPCFNIECLKVDADVNVTDQKRLQPTNYSLFYANDLCPQFDRKHSVDCLTKPDTRSLQMLFPLRGQADWAMGGNGLSLRLKCPKDFMIILRTISAEPINRVMPELSFQPNANQNILGFIELNDKYPTCQLNYSGRNIRGAEKLVLERTMPDQTFAVSNDVMINPVSTSPQTKELNGLNGLLLLSKQDFDGPGIYGIRLRALDSKNNPVGIAGDHIVITVK